PPRGPPCPRVRARRPLSPPARRGPLPQRSEGRERADGRPSRRAPPGPPRPGARARARAGGAPPPGEERGPARAHARPAGERDRTAALARRFTDRVLVNPWPGYRAQKQYALDAARGAWALNLDADERVSPELVDEIRAVLAHVPARVAGFAIPRLVCYLGRWW